MWAWKARGAMTNFIGLRYEVMDSILRLTVMCGCSVNTPNSTGFYSSSE